MNIDTDCYVCGEAVFEGQRPFEKVLWDRVTYSVWAWRHLDQERGGTCWDAQAKRAHLKFLLDQS